MLSLALGPQPFRPVLKATYPVRVRCVTRVVGRQLQLTGGELTEAQEPVVVTRQAAQLELLAVSGPAPFWSFQESLRSALVCLCYCNAAQTKTGALLSWAAHPQGMVYLVGVELSSH